jgi:hypothetical protein
MSAPKAFGDSYQRVEPPLVAAATYGVPRDNAFHLGQPKFSKKLLKMS